MHISIRLAKEIIFLSVCFLIAACDSLPGLDSDPSDPPPVTEIIAVKVEPNPVVVGDTTKLTAIIKDSLRTDLGYLWSVRGTGIILGTDSNIVNGDEASVFVVAGSNPGEYICKLEVSDDQGAEGIVSTGFTISVVSE